MEAVRKALGFFKKWIFATIEQVVDCNRPANDPLLTENNSEASWSCTMRQSKEKPLKRKRMDVIHEEPEPQPEGAPRKRRRTGMEQNIANREKMRKDSVAPCSYTIRQRALKRKRMDVIHEEPEPQPEETPRKRRRTDTEKKETHPVRRINPFRDAKFCGRYSIMEPLGRGAYGYVYAGVRKSDGKKVALKFIPRLENESLITLPGDTRRLPVEVALMELVCKPPRCPYVIELLEWFERPTVFILVLERPDRCVDLYRHCQNLRQKMSESEAQIVIQQVIHAARHCRDRGVFHRDIKEENILVEPKTLKVKLIDFGCGDLLKDTYKTYSGTRRYVPPEWFFKKKYEAEPATTWGIGILLYRLICGAKLFITEEEIVTGNLYFTDDMSAACCSLIEWCLEWDPQKRPNLEQILAHHWFLRQTA